LSLRYNFIRTLKSIVCGPDAKMHSGTDNVCNQEVFQIWFYQLVREAKYEKRISSWWEKNVVLNTVCREYTALPVIQFLQCDIFIHAPLVLYILLYGI
jgi:hypothetical protein